MTTKTQKNETFDELVFRFVFFNLFWRFYSSVVLPAVSAMDADSEAVPPRAVNAALLGAIKQKVPLKLAR